MHKLCLQQANQKAMVSRYMLTVLTFPVSWYDMRTSPKKNVSLQIFQTGKFMARPFFGGGCGWGVIRLTQYFYNENIFPKPLWKTCDICLRYYPHIITLNTALAPGCRGCGLGSVIMYGLILSVLFFRWCKVLFYVK